MLDLIELIHAGSDRVTTCRTCYSMLDPLRYHMLGPNKVNTCRTHKLPHAGPNKVNTFRTHKLPHAKHDKVTKCWYKVLKRIPKYIRLDY
jgi:hypothetical protein